MIEALKVENFKSFHRLNLDKLTRFTLISGANNVGKSSLLEAIFLLYNVWNDDLFIRQYKLRRLTGGGQSHSLDWIEFFYNFNDLLEISIQTETSEKTLQKILCHMQTVSSTIFSGQKKEQGAALDFQAPVGLQNSDRSMMPVMNVEFWEGGEKQYSRMIYPNMDEIHVNDRDRVPTLNIPSVWIAIPSLIPNGASLFSELDVNNQMDIVIDFLRIIEPKIKGLSIGLRGNQNEIYVDIGLKRKLPMKMMGEAMQRLLLFVLTCAQVKGGIILIDEIENGLHWRIHSQVWRELCQIAKHFDCQVIATTHSYEFIRGAFEGLNEELQKQFSYIRLDRIQDDIQGKIFHKDELDWVFRMNAEVR